MSIGDFFKKILGFPADTATTPVKPGAGEKTVGDLEYELARRKAQEAREAQAGTTTDNQLPGTQQ